MQDTLSVVVDTLKDSVVSTAVVSQGHPVLVTLGVLVVVAAVVLLWRKNRKNSATA